MSKAGLRETTQTRQGAEEDRRQSKEKPMLSSTGVGTPRKRGGGMQDAKYLFPHFSGGGEIRPSAGRTSPQGTGGDRPSSARKAPPGSRRSPCPRQGSSGALPYRGRRDSCGGIRQRRGIPTAAVQISPNLYSRTGRTGHP